MKIITTTISIFWLLITFTSNAANFNLDTGYAASADKYNKTLINEVDMAGSRIIGVGIHGVIIYSDDQGKNWQQSKVPTTKTLTAIDCLNDKLCWAVGHDAYILKTTDGGENWKLKV